MRQIGNLDDGVRNGGSRRVCNGSVDFAVDCGRLAMGDWLEHSCSTGSENEKSHISEHRVPHSWFLIPSQGEAGLIDSGRPEELGLYRSDGANKSGISIARSAAHSVQFIRRTAYSSVRGAVNR